MMSSRRVKFTYTVEQYDFADNTLFVTYEPLNPELPSALVRVQPGDTEAETIEAILVSAPVETWEFESDRRRDESCLKAATYVGLTGEARGLDVERARKANGRTAQQEADFAAAKNSAKAALEWEAERELNRGVEWTFDDGYVGRVQCTERTVAFLTANAVGGKGCSFRTLDNTSHPLAAGKVKALLAEVQRFRQQVLEGYWEGVSPLDTAETLREVNAVIQSAYSPGS